jgi:hypothetical protein
VEERHWMGLGLGAGIGALLGIAFPIGMALWRVRYGDMNEAALYLGAVCLTLPGGALLGAVVGFVVAEEASLGPRRQQRGGGGNPRRRTTAPSEKSSGFWTGGPKAYRDALSQEYDARLAELRERLAQSGTEDERRRLQAEIQATQIEHKKKIKEIDGLLF